MTKKRARRRNPWKRSYSVGSKDFRDLASAKKYAQEWADEDGREVDVTIHIDKVPDVRNRLFGYSVMDHKEKYVTVKPKKTNPKKILPRGKWINAKIRVTKNGTIQAKIKR